LQKKAAAKQSVVVAHDGLEPAALACKKRMTPPARSGSFFSANGEAKHLSGK
jgi:hypothetical protein